MEFLIFIGGVILGVVAALIYKSREKIQGIIHIDHNTEQCVFSITSDQLMKRNKKIAVFYINHKAELSREEQGL